MANMKRLKDRFRKNKNSIILLSLYLALFFLLIFFVLKLIPEDEPLDFEHIDGKEHAVFEIENPSTVAKLCFFTVTTDIGEFDGGNETIPANSKKQVQVPVEVPSGKSKVELTYTCYNSTAPLPVAN